MKKVIFTWRAIILLNDVDEQATKKSHFSRSDEPIVSHEFCGCVKSFAAIVEENTGVDTTVYQQKSHQG